jgi:seryl-tRNA synthetase
MTPQNPGQAAGQAYDQLGLLKAQRSALTDQLESQTIRRDYLNQQLAHASGGTAASIQAQIAEVDASVKATNAALSRVDAAVNKVITSGLPTSASEVARDARSDIDRISTRVGAFSSTAVVAMLVVLVISMRRRRSAPAQLSQQDAMRLDHLQRAVDTIAIEVERISESQRFIARNVAEEKKAAP